MEPSRLRRVVTGAAALFFLAASPAAHAATGMHRSLAQLVQQSDATVLGHTLALASFWDHGRIVTRTQVRVDEVWHGAVRLHDTLEVYSLGGVVGDIGQRVDGAAALPSYGRVVLHLRRARRGYVPTGMAQGVWNVDALYGSNALVHAQAPLAFALPTAATPQASDAGGRTGSRPAFAGRPPASPPSAALPQSLAALRAAVQEAYLARP